LRRAPLAIGVLLSRTRGRGRQAAMTERDGKATREERLAAKLRENLRRRKAQARAIDDRGSALPKPPEES